MLGGGPIGIELSQGLNRLGVKIYIVEMMPRILFREDIDIAQILENKLEIEGMQILTGKRAVKFSKEAQAVTVTLEDKERNQEQITAENVLVAVGRAPNLEGLNLGRPGVEYEKDGLIKVITDNKGYILGAHITGANAGEIIHGFLIAKSLKFPLIKLSRPSFIYPTLSELLKHTAAKPLLDKINNPFIRILIGIMRNRR